MSRGLWRAMAPPPNPDSFDSDGNRAVPRHKIRIALHLSLLSASAVWVLELIADKQWHEHHPGMGASSVPVPLWISIVVVAFPVVLYLLCVSLLSSRSEELIAAGAGIAAGISPFSLIFPVATFLGMSLSFFPDPYTLPVAISLLVLFCSGVWMAVAAFRIGKVNWGAFLLAAVVTFIGLAICVSKAMGS